MMRKNLSILFIAIISSFVISCTPKLIGSAKDTHAGDSLSVIIIGDWGVGATAAQLAVADQIDKISRQHNVQFIITTGDNFYNAGVTSTSDPQWQKSFEQVYNKPGHQVRWYPVLGNHDYGSSTQAQIDYSSVGNRWTMPAHYYSLERKMGKAKVLFAFADINPFINAYYKYSWPDLRQQDTAAQYQWLQKTLATKATWKVMIGHQPFYSAGAYGNSAELINRFKPLLLQTNTDFYVAGHDHNLQHIKLPQERVHYLVSGGGGRGLYALKQKDENVRYAESINGFLLMTFYSNHVNFCYYNDQGEVVYRQQVTKNSR